MTKTTLSPPRPDHRRGGPFRRLVRSVAGCRNDRRGAASLMTAAMIVPLIGISALSVDAARGYLVRMRLAAAVDAAALAAGRVLDTSDATSDAIMYFRANIPSDYMGATVPDPTVTIGPQAEEPAEGESAVTPTPETVTIRATAVVPVTLLQILGFSTFTVTAENRARRLMSGGLELALVLDTTGSMWTDDRIGKMREAATTLVNILYGSEASSNKLWVSVVPYTAEVNLGTDRTDWLDAASPTETSFSPTSWRGCVEARPAPNDEDDAPPAAARFRRFLYPTTKGTYQEGGDNDWPAVTDTGSYTYSNELTGPNLGCGLPVLPLTNVKQTLLDKIATLYPVNRGGTMSNIGLQAGWFTLSPSWRGLWGGPTPAGMPLDYGAPDMTKAVVLVTDGNNEWFDYGKPPTGDYTAYGRIEEGRLGTTAFSSATTELNNRMSRMCDRMKNPGATDAQGRPLPGITIYTITIGQTNAATQTLFRNCASQPSYYWDTPSPDQLKAVFQTIGSQLTNLRLEK